jgi:hypothetical protein
MRRGPRLNGGRPGKKVEEMNEEVRVPLLLNTASHSYPEYQPFEVR